MSIDVPISQGIPSARTAFVLTLLLLLCAPGAQASGDLLPQVDPRDLPPVGGGVGGGPCVSDEGISLDEKCSGGETLPVHIADEAAKAVACARDLDACASH